MSEITTPDAIQMIAAALFAVGIYGVLARRNLLIILMSVGANAQRRQPVDRWLLPRDGALSTGPAAEPAARSSC